MRGTQMDVIESYGSSSAPRFSRFLDHQGLIESVTNNGGHLGRFVHDLLTCLSSLRTRAMLAVVINSCGLALFGVFDEHLLEDRGGSLKSSAGRIWAR